MVTCPRCGKEGSLKAKWSKSYNAPIFFVVHIKKRGRKVFCFIPKQKALELMKEEQQMTTVSVSSSSKTDTKSSS